ncbi:peroxisome biogenesis factor 10 [Puttea exsequens]|nr:peroxisome biogenesis factor 10 [Puttea exsequens]
MADSSIASNNARDVQKSTFSPSNYAYPYAAAPDIIRSNQKDTYFKGVLFENLSTILRRLYGSRFAHTYDSEARTFSELLYLGLTTFVGNRTLGEEYCDIYQVESASQKLPEVGHRAGYILSAVLLPYTFTKVLPKLRSRIRLKLESNLTRSPKSSRTSISYHLQRYLYTNLATITSISTSPIYALNLAVFYFTGSYYHLSKRLFGLRYIFSKHLAPSEQRVGYEVLGVLLMLQMIVQACLHVQSTVDTNLPAEGSSAMLDDGVEVGMLGQQDNANAIDLSLDPAESTESADISRFRVSHATHTPLPPASHPRYDLSEASTLAWLQPSQQRKCTLCLEPMKDPSVTTCGHVFCWTCILDWVAEKPECPLCRQGVLGQHVLPLRG